MHPKPAKGEIYQMSTSTTPSTVTTWNIDPAHSAAEFKVRHMMIAHVKGSIRGLKGVLTLDEADYTRFKVTASADINTLNTGEPQRDGHLKSADFFDAEKYPELTFESTAVKRTGDGEYEVKGNLTIHGVTKQVTFAVEGLGSPNKDPWGNLRVGVSATTKINRKDFGLTWNSTLETGGVLVGDDVTLTIDAQFIKAA
jgi:polyisoprenoid-binding protein YceI